MSSFIIRDALGPAVGTSNQRLALWRRFKAVWPQDETKGLYNEKLYYYERGHLLDTTEFKRFLNIIGMKYQDLKDQDYDEIKSCWFYLKPPTLKNAVFTTIEMLDAMGTEKPLQGDVVTLKFRYGGVNKRLPGDSYEVTNTTETFGNVNYDQIKAMSPLDIQTEIMSNPGNYVMSMMPRSVAGTRDKFMYAEKDEYFRLVNMDPSSKNAYKKELSKLYEEPVCQITSDSKYGWYAIFDDTNFNFTVREMSDPIPLPYGDGYGLEWTISYNVTRTLQSNDPCMTAFEPMFNERSELPKANGSLPYKVTETDFRETAEVTDTSMWPNGFLSVPKSDTMKKKDFADMVGTCIDSDYKVEDPSFWEKLVAVVIIIVAVVVSVLSCGSLAGMAWPAAMAAISFAFAMGGIVLGIGSALLGYFGGPSANSLVKVIGNIAQYVGVIASVLGITAFVGNFVKSFSSEAIMKAATKEAATAARTAGGKNAGKIASEAVLKEATSLASSNAFTRATHVAANNISSALSFSGNSVVEVSRKLTTWTDGAFRIYKYYDQNYGDTADIMQKNKELADQVADLNEENANSKMMVMGQDIYAYSLGSYDAIAETNIRIDKQGGGWYTGQDPCASIT